MDAIAWRILTALVLLALAVCCTARRCPLLHAAEGTNRTGCYIVVLNRTTTQERFDEILKRAASMAEGFKVTAVVRTASKAFTAKLSAYSLSLLRQFPEVDYIEEETMAEGAQQTTSVPWHLDRLDQRSLPLDSSYQPIGNGEGVDIYVLDSGINYSHEEFENRAKYAGYDPMDVHAGESRRGSDCHGHGTHVASLAGGEKYGAAKKATLYSVRVLDCQNRGPWSTTLEGIDYAMRFIAERKRPAVVSMSLSGGFMRSVNDAVGRLQSSGVPVVVAAGNTQSDACSRTPASSPSVITVAGSAVTDGIYFATNYGRCVNIFAPGNAVRGANFLCSNCSKLLSGTSMSTPLVSGVIAILLQREPTSTPQEIVSRLNSLSITGALDLRRIPSNFRRSTPNRVVSIPGSCGGEVPVHSGATAEISTPNHPSNYPTNLLCRWVVRSSEGRLSRISFASFRTERLYDAVRVCSGLHCDDTSLIASLNGSLFGSQAFVSRSNVLTIELQTDGMIGAAGFRATASNTNVPGPTSVPPTTSPTSPTSPTSSPPTLSSPTTCTPTDPNALNITTSLQTTIAEARALLSQAISSSLDNLLKRKLADIEARTKCTALLEPTDSSTALPATVGSVTTTSAATPSATTSVLTEPPTQRTCLGCALSNPASSCVEIFRSTLNAVSGYYWVQSRNSALNVYCDMSTRCNNTGGWMRIANLDMSDTTQNCPSGFGFVARPKRTCGRNKTSPGCSSAFYSTRGLSYSQVCGRVIGYQFSSPNAFFAHQYDPTITIDQYYLDGVSLTRGSPRRHVWSFAAAIDERRRDRHICPCSNSEHTLPSTALPPFIGNDYFCDSGTDSFRFGVFHTADPLWDGQGCGARSTCCTFNRPPWFCKDLRSSSSDDVEVRICGNENRSNEDTPVEIIELYVK